MDRMPDDRSPRPADGPPTVGRGPDTPDQPDRVGGTRSGGPQESDDRPTRVGWWTPSGRDGEDRPTLIGRLTGLGSRGRSGEDGGRAGDRPGGGSRAARGEAAKAVPIDSRPRRNDRPHLRPPVPKRDRSGQLDWTGVLPQAWSDPATLYPPYQPDLTPGPGRPAPGRGDQDPSRSDRSRPHPDRSRDRSRPAQPGPNQPGPNQPGSNQPGAGQQGPNQPGAGQQGSNQPGAGQQGPNQPGAGQPAPNQPGSPRPGTGPHQLGTGPGQPGGAPQPGPNQPGPNQPGPNQPGPNQPGPNQPGPNQPGWGRPHPGPSQPPYLDRNQMYAPGQAPGQPTQAPPPGRPGAPGQPYPQPGPNQGAPNQGAPNQAGPETAYLGPAQPPTRRGPRRPVPPPWLRAPGEHRTGLNPPFADLDQPTIRFRPVRLPPDDPTEVITGGPATAEQPSLARSSTMMAIANLASRVTGFARQVALAAVLSFGLVNSAYTVGNTLPNIVYEFLLGGVLTSVMIPLLVRAQNEDDDGGDAYTRRLLTMSAVALAVATVIAVLAARPLVELYVGNQTTDTANPELTTAFAILLLPEIFFYGIGALLGAILNSKGKFGAFAWAPVLNNLVVLVVLVVYVLVPGEISLDPVRMGDPKLLVLGIGTTLGIVVQALVMLPAVRKVGISLKPMWGWDKRLSSAGGLALWVVGYVLAGQIGVIVTSRVAAVADPGAYAIYSNAWLLLQVPYGVLGVSLLTALMPRMSIAAAEDRVDDVVKDLSLGSRLSTVFLVPISVLLTFFGTEVGLALFSLGAGNAGGGAAKLGEALAWSAFGLMPYAVTLLQLRVFYAMTDSRTPTLIMLAIQVVKLPLLFLSPVIFRPEDVVLGLSAANSLSFVFGAILGQWVIRRRLGYARTHEVISTTWRTVVASVAGGTLAYLICLGVAALVGRSAGGAWVVLLVGLVVAVPVMLGLMRLLRLPELDPLWSRLPAPLGTRGT